MKAGLRRTLQLIGIVTVLIAAAAFIEIRSLDQPLTLSGVTRFKVPPGTRFARVAMELHHRGIVAAPRAWALYARWVGADAGIKAGEYEIQPGITPRALLAKMVRGEVLLFPCTVIDGWRLRDLLEALRRTPELVTTLPVDPTDLLVQLGFAAGEAEGQFLPDTYLFESGTTDVQILQKAHLALVHELDSAWAGRDPDIPLRTAAELLIVASIVEKETAVPAELPLVAGLYLHRLAIGMRLQADPTVIYGLGDRYDGELHTRDLRADGPYNSYTRVGLPPTPIALPGRAAIRATARPAATDALYFVASDRDDGTHVFSATLAAQNAAVARYVAHRRAQAAHLP